MRSASASAAGSAGAIGMIVLAALLGLAVCCVSAYIGLAVKDEEAVQAFGLIWVFPLTFISSAFVQIQTMPSWLQGFARNQPFTEVIDALRLLRSATVQPVIGQSLASSLLQSVAWLVGRSSFSCLSRRGPTGGRKAQSVPHEHGSALYDGSFAIRRADPAIARRSRAEGLPNHEDRPEQLAMAEAVGEAIERHRHLVVQAGTGTGKSLAYLVPALALGARVVVSTATKALQDQLAGRDLPQLSRSLGVRFHFAVLKGRSNYVCLQRVAELTGGTRAAAAGTRRWLRQRLAGAASARSAVRSGGSSSWAEGGDEGRMARKPGAKGDKTGLSGR